MSTTAVPPAHPTDLEPSLVAPRVYASRRGGRVIDVVTVIQVMLVLLFVLPAGLIVPDLTSAGRPGLILGLALGFVWVVAKLHPRLAMRGPQPVRWAIMLYTASTLISYAAGLLRGLPGLEANAANRALIMHVVLIGIALAAADGVANRAGLDAVVRVFVWCAAAMAVIGMLQSFAQLELGPLMVIPGLEYHSQVQGFEFRGGPNLYRVASTTAHYIEFSTVMAMAIPFGIHVARFAESPRLRRSALVATGLIAIALPLTISRTGVVALGVALLPMMVVWSARMRLAVAVGIVAVIGALAAVKPGLLTTLRGLFSGWDADPSIQDRTSDYAAIAKYVTERPWFGRGSGTFIPELYRFLDNQWLGVLVERGVVGVAALAGLHVVTCVLIIVTYRRSRLEADRHLCAALFAVQLLAVVVAFTFDSLAFTTFAATLALMTGLAAALWRLNHPAQVVRTATTRSID